jgi:glycosyltransferase 2 family protein
MNPPSSKTRPRALAVAARALVALSLLGLAVWMNRGQLSDVFSREVDLRLFALGFVFYMSGVLLAYVRWFLLGRALDLPFRLRDAFRLGFIGTLFNLVIPGAVGGDVIKAAYLCREQGRKGQAIASVVIDRMIGLIGLFALACASGSLAWSLLEPPVRRLATAAWIFQGVFCALLAIAFTPALYRPLRKRLGKGKKPAHVLDELIAMGTAYRQRFGVVVLSAAMATVTHVLNIFAFYAVSRAMFPEVPGLAQHFLIVPLVLFSTAVPLPFGALGVTEQISYVLFNMTRYSGGAVAMMAFRTLQYAGATIGLGVYIANASQVRALQEAAEHLDDEPAPWPEADPGPEETVAVAPAEGDSGRR